MKSLVALPVLGLAMIFQSAIVSRINLLSGCADLLLLVVAAWGMQTTARYGWIWAGVAGLLVGYVSQLPVLVTLAAYLLVMLVAFLLKRQIWQAPLLGMYVVTFAGTLITQSAAYLTLWFTGNQLSLGEAFLQVMLPSLLLNLLVAIPMQAVIHDLALWVHPPEIVT